ncbi:GntR family transcriptional regulator [Diaminobutyricibacter tongyongensis]|uniref:GntR family transcriptional regulator n=1 Tax=Leifsonia tongyongensis TaxID=1268043 RepID=A0A6L9XVX7_9MICO|nr:GntR family transcriptional regulator [Diaminobutyricibacter tongyongensis]NEN05581.1 GntR family transcriptional regulator [Diaminobutyricibacter tongyongensis]
MTFRIDDESGVPPFEQVKHQVIEKMRSGELPAGAKLPTVRHLADELGLAANTVARAYRELEQAEVIETRGRNGSYIAASGDGTTRQVQLAAAAFADTVRELDADPELALDLAAAALRVAR